ncbi:MAG TPA: aldo/keto reductase, partial [Anaerovoracaceae bacterium]|nr:aldo/keto reductase [Anaerovoracaceae bacterium]
FNFPPVDKEKAYDIIDVMIRIGQKHSETAAQVALAWVLAQPGVTSVIIGAKNLVQLNDNLNSVNLKLTDEELTELNKVSEISAEYPGWMVNRQSQGRYPA